VRTYLEGLRSLGQCRRWHGSDLDEYAELVPHTPVLGEPVALGPNVLVEFGRYLHRDLRGPSKDTAVRGRSLPCRPRDQGPTPALRRREQPDDRAAVTLAPSTLYRVYYGARDKAGRPDLRFHDLRHTGAVLAASTGATLAELMGRLAHSTPQAALRYQHAAQGRDAVIAIALSRLATGEG